jgi:NAD(P)-dependent dehydrogenase (short-subunit alcohol dehydrogenase family)
VDLVPTNAATAPPSAYRTGASAVGVGGDDPYQLMDAIAEHFGHPAHLPRSGLPDEMGSVVAFLASRPSSYMTGRNVTSTAALTSSNRTIAPSFGLFGPLETADDDGCRMQYR